jgi:hypothetical protein
MTASGSRDGTIKLWNVLTGECIKTLCKDHEYDVEFVVFSPDGKMLASSSSNGNKCSIAPSIRRRPVENTAHANVLCGRHSYAIHGIGGPYWTCLSVATGLALIALALALWRRTRRASRWVAIASIVASINPFAPDSLISNKDGAHTAVDNGTMLRAPIPRCLIHLPIPNKTCSIKFINHFIIINGEKLMEGKWLTVGIILFVHRVSNSSF